MRIAESTLQMASLKREESRAELSLATRTRERQLVRPPATLQPTVAPEKPTAAPPQGSGALPSAALLAREPKTRNEACLCPKEVGESKGDPRLDPTLRLLKTLLARFFGVDVALFNPHELEVKEESSALPGDTPANSAAATGQRAPSEEGVWVERTTVLEATATVVKSEALTFAASGIVRTADGRTIEFAAGFALSRQERASLTMTLGTLEQSVERRKKDPLVIDFAGSSSELVDIGFGFDLTGTGEKINLPAPARGLGYLVFDRNGNGRVDDGRELFGPTSGDGFAELAALDEDGNGWIDEGDSAFSALYVWHPFAPDRLIALKAADIGALATPAVATPWAIANTQGESAGALSKTSIYLKESGGVGTVSHLDLNI